MSFTVSWFFRWEFETLAELMTVTKRGDRGSLSCLNLRVNDTITMPTPAIAMETIFIASTG